MNAEINEVRIYLGFLPSHSIAAINPAHIDLNVLARTLRRVNRRIPHFTDVPRSHVWTRKYTKPTWFWRTSLARSDAAINESRIGLAFLARTFGLGNRGSPHRYGLPLSYAWTRKCTKPKASRRASFARSDSSFNQVLICLAYLFRTLGRGNLPSPHRYDVPRSHVQTRQTINSA